MPAEMRIGDSIVMISDGGGRRETMPGFLYVYVKDADETYRRAVDAGAASLEKTGDGARFLGQHLADRDAQGGLASPDATR